MKPPQIFPLLMKVEWSKRRLGESMALAWGWVRELRCSLLFSSGGWWAVGVPTIKGLCLPLLLKIFL